MSNFIAFDPLEFDPWQSATVDLSEGDIDGAIQACQHLPQGHLQWQGYLQAIAVKGFAQWLATSDLELFAEVTADAGLAAGVTCRIGAFRVYLIAQGSLSDGVIEIPQGTLEATDKAIHLYVLAMVQDETNQVTILGGLRRDRLLVQQQQSALAADGQGNYECPVAWFDSSPEQLLLWLTCLNPETLMMATNRSLAQPGQQQISPQAVKPINVGRWLNGQLDTVAKRLDWIFMPPLATAHGMMSDQSPAAQLENILAEIEPSVMVPDSVKSAYTDCQTMGQPFRLYTLVWPILTTDVPEWSLLLVLGPGETGQLPTGMQLLVGNPGTVLAQQVLTAEVGSSYLYAQVFGTWDETFVATVQLPNGATINFPPFVFRPHQ